MTHQLPLPFADPQPYNQADFIAAPCNALAQSWLKNPSGWTNGRLILWGDPGCGKTFLLHLWARQTGAVIHQGTSLDLLPPPPVTPIAIDDADTAPDEAALLHVLNAAAEAGQPVLLTARQPPSRQPIALADLASRLRASLTVEIAPPDDAMLRTLLVHLTTARQLNFPAPVTNFLLQRLPRTPAALRQAVTRLDHAALATGKKITRAMAAETLADLLHPASHVHDQPLLSNLHSPDRSNLV